MGTFSIHAESPDAASLPNGWQQDLEVAIGNAGGSDLRVAPDTWPRAVFSFLLSAESEQEAFKRGEDVLRTAIGPPFAWAVTSAMRHP